MESGRSKVKYVRGVLDLQRSRGWFITAWPDKREEGQMASDLVNKCHADDKIEYAACFREICPETGKEHFHLWVYWQNAITPKGMADRLGLVHGEYNGQRQRGTHQQVLDYIEKDADIVFCHGEIPKEDEKKTSAWDYILEMLENGATDSEIMRAYPAHFGRCRQGIAGMRMELLSERINTWRDVEVTYIWGETGAGKTRGVLEQTGNPIDVYRVTDYNHPFDNYRGQKILLLEEFRSSLPIEQMLVYLDGYFCELPCRYANKVSGWEQVYIVTNIPMDHQFAGVQANHPETWQAFLRRIDAQVHMGHLKGNNRPFEDRSKAFVDHQMTLEEKLRPRVEATTKMLGHPPAGYREYMIE